MGWRMEDRRRIEPSSVLYPLSNSERTPDLLHQGGRMADQPQRSIAPDAPTIVDPRAQPKARSGRRAWRPAQQSEAYLFLLPSFAGFFMFVMIPVLGSLALSFVNWNLLNPPRFIG